jgi:hypothetical protein
MKRAGKIKACFHEGLRVCGKHSCRWKRFRIHQPCPVESCVTGAECWIWAPHGHCPATCCISASMPWVQVLGKDKDAVSKYWKCYTVKIKQETKLQTCSPLWKHTIIKRKGCAPYINPHYHYSPETWRAPGWWWQLVLLLVGRSGRNGLW